MVSFQLQSIFILLGRRNAKEIKIVRFVSKDFTLPIHTGRSYSDNFHLFCALQLPCIFSSILQSCETDWQVTVVLCHTESPWRSEEPHEMLRFLPVMNNKTDYECMGMETKNTILKIQWKRRNDWDLEVNAIYSSCWLPSNSLII